MTPDPATRHVTARPMRQMPVISLGDPALVEVVRAGVRRAGDDPAILVTHGADTDTLLAASADGSEVVVALSEGPAAVAVVNAVLELGGRPILALSLRPGGRVPALSDATLRLLKDPELAEVIVAVPSLGEDRLRRALWDGLRAARVEERHQPVEVDGRPAVDEHGARGAPLPAHLWTCLAAGAAGVLAGRMAASRRRWRTQLEA